MGKTKVSKCNDPKLDSPEHTQKLDSIVPVSINPTHPTRKWEEETGKISEAHWPTILLYAVVIKRSCLK